MRITVLGCGPAGGVPSVSAGWGNCDPADPRNRRRRPSLLVQADDGTTVLIDTSPDLRDQLLDAGVRRLDAVLFTHGHADHLHGIDELREVNRVMQAPIPVHGDAAMLEVIGQRFDYVFTPLETAYYYKPVLLPMEITGPFQVGGLHIVPFVQDHGLSRSLGFRLNDMAYSTDVVRLDDDAFRVLHGLRLWVVAAFHERAHPTHANLETTLGWIDRVRPRRAVLTHMSGALDYGDLRRRLPAGVEPAHDGMVIDLE